MVAETGVPEKTNDLSQVFTVKNWKLTDDDGQKDTKAMAKSQMALGMRPGDLISRRADILIFDHILVSGISVIIVSISFIFLLVNIYIIEMDIIILNIHSFIWKKKLLFLSMLLLD
jgi:hypothetical protein